MLKFIWVFCKKLSQLSSITRATKRLKLWLHKQDLEYMHLSQQPYPSTVAAASFEELEITSSSCTNQKCFNVVKNWEVCTIHLLLFYLLSFCFFSISHTKTKMCDFPVLEKGWEHKTRINRLSNVIKDCTTLPVWALYKQSR